MISASGAVGAGPSRREMRLGITGVARPQMRAAHTAHGGVAGFVEITPSFREYLGEMMSQLAARGALSRLVGSRCGRG
jgi:hypothetical protein